SPASRPGRHRFSGAHAHRWPRWMAVGERDGRARASPSTAAPGHLRPSREVSRPAWLRLGDADAVRQHAHPGQGPGRPLGRPGGPVARDADPGVLGPAAQGYGEGEMALPQCRARLRVDLVLTPATVEASARASFEMHRTRARYGPLDATVRAAPLDDAYRIQDALHRLLGEAGRGDIVGGKIALTSKAMQQRTGVNHPAAGALLS